MPDDISLAVTEQYTSFRKGLGHPEERYRYRCSCGKNLYSQAALRMHLRSHGIIGAAALTITREARARFHGAAN